MRGTIASALALILSTASAARAQPAAPTGPPGTVRSVPPPYAYQPQPRRVVLSTGDADLLERGEVSDAAWLGGGVAALCIGLGVGQAIQGRWGDDGWIFTVGEPAALIAFGVGAAEGFSGNNNGTWLVAGGLIGFVGLHIWEVVDAFATPPADNRRLHQLREQLGLPPEMASRLRPYVAPPRDGAGGGVAGVALSF